MSFANLAFVFRSAAIEEEDTLLVTKVRGEERLSAPFRFELELVSRRADLDLADLVHQPARIGFRQGVTLPGGQKATTTRWTAGILSSMSQLEEGKGWVRYHATLVPRLSELTERFRSRVFLDASAPELVARLLDEAGLASGVDYALSPGIQQALGEDPRARDVYPGRDYVVQYEETDLDFVSRWLEHEGIFYVFENEDEERDKVCFGDSVADYRPLRSPTSLAYQPQASAPDGIHYDPTVHAFSCTQGRLPKTVVLNDYNWRSPSSGLRCSAEVPGGRGGVQYFYNDHYKTEGQGKALAKVRAEELACRGRVFHGDSDCRAFRPGRTFELTDHYQRSFDGSYLLTRVVHEAEQELSFDRGAVTGSRYRNSFEAIPADQTFRPATTTPWPAIKGVMHGRIDAEGDGEYAELDDQGQYKVRVPFDVDEASHPAGRASRRVRMAQPYAGPNEGFHFPLRRGTEVLLTHIDGDPDRPLIAGAVPNPESISPVDGGNSSQSRITTKSGNEVTFDDREGSQGILITNAGGSVYNCYFRPGGLGQSGGGGGAGIGGGSGGAVTGPPSAGPPPPPPSGDAPGPGMGMPSVADLNETGAKGWFQTDDFKKQSHATSAEITASLGEIYRRGESVADRIADLNAKCSKFEAAVGAYDITVGPSMEVKFGDTGEYQEGNKIVEIQCFHEIYEELDAKVNDSGTCESKVGTKRRFDTIKETVKAKVVESTTGGALWADRCERVEELVGANVIVDLKFAEVVTESSVVTALMNANTVCPVINENTACLNKNEFFLGTQFALGGPAKLEIWLGGDWEIGIDEGKVKINGTDAKISELEGKITTQSGKISTVEGAVSSLTGKVSDNETAITDTKTSVTRLETSVNETKTAVSETNTKVSKNELAMNRSTMALHQRISGLAVQLGI